MKRIWIDTSIGADPGDAVALYFACKHPELDVVGVSIVGKKQPQRVEEANRVLDYADCGDVPVFYGDDLRAQDISELAPDHTITLGPLTNIARLILEEADMGMLHICAGALSATLYRGQEITAEPNATRDLDATRVVLTQASDACISPFEVSSTIVCGGEVLAGIESRHAFLKNRFEGFREHLIAKYGEQDPTICLNALLPFCDVLNTTSISREIIEFVIQADGSWRSTHALGQDRRIDLVENPESIACPTVKHEVIRSVDPQKVLQELAAVV